MKLLSTAFAFVAILSFSFVSFSQWEYVGNDNFSAGGLSGACLEINQETGVPYISYYDNEAIVPQLYVKKLVDGIWTDLSDEIISEFPISWLHNFKINPVDHLPYLLYRDTDSAYVKKFNGDEWEQVGRAFLSSGHRHGLDFDKRTGTPYVFIRLEFDDIDYEIEGEGYNPYKVFKLVDGEWNVFGATAFGGNPLDYRTLIINEAEEVFVCGDDAGAVNYHSKFSPEGTLTTLPNMNSVFAPCINSSFNNRLLYSESDNLLYDVVFNTYTGMCPDVIMSSFAVSTWNGDSWTNIGGGEEDEDINIFAHAYGGDIMMNETTGEVWLLYTQFDNETSNIVMNLKSWNGSEWEDVVDPEIVGNVIDREGYEMMQADTKGFQIYQAEQKVYGIVHSRVDGKISVVSYGPDEPSAIENIAHEIKIYKGADKGEFILETEMKIDQITVYSIDGSLIVQNDQPNQGINTVNLIKSGVYIVTLINDNQERVSKKLVVQ
ncbi:T9SS type A sorting domain-containing protein [Crocinitomix catalasitica]|uniref:T9SS type A sorting domain-containing protein n=1 Tax=Crocinitomix catalasitica TaxID=184607 RepID=UPI00048746D8|nr:T9SS type A sorting domain-containing protein [Crocinitomix catalasitica]